MYSTYHEAIRAEEARIVWMIPASEKGNRLAQEKRANTGCTLTAFGVGTQRHFGRKSSFQALSSCQNRRQVSHSVRPLRIHSIAIFSK